jgi:hypothetical protein
MGRKFSWILNNRLLLRMQVSFTSAIAQEAPGRPCSWRFNFLSIDFFWKMTIVGRPLAQASPSELVQAACS